MSEMNELTRSLEEVQKMIEDGASFGAHRLWTPPEHARQAVLLIKAQAALLTKQQLEIITLKKDVEIQKERADMQYKRAESAEAEIKELDEQEPFKFISDSGDVRDAADAHNEFECFTPLYARPVPAHKLELEIQRLVAMNDSLLANEKRLIESLRLARSNQAPAKSVPDDGEIIMIED